MSIRVERAEFDPLHGFLYYVIFKPNLESGLDDVVGSEEVEVVVALTETGELARVTFIAPKTLRSQQALSFICADEQASYVAPHVYFAFPGRSGDAVQTVPGRLEVDLAGRIVGMLIQWQPAAV